MQDFVKLKNSKMYSEKVEPLFRKEKKTGLSTHYYVVAGSDYRRTRNSKKQKEFDGHKQPMNTGKWGVDYTPLYRYLLSKVGQKWADVYSAICARLPIEHRDAIWHMVKTHKEDLCFRGGEHSYYSTLIVEYGILVKVDGENKFDPKTLHKCTCCTHTFNGKVI